MSSQPISIRYPAKSDVAVGLGALGSSSTYRVWLEEILGSNVAAMTDVNPVIPRKCCFKMRYRFQNTLYRIAVEILTTVCPVIALEMDGIWIADKSVKLRDDGNKLTKCVLSWETNRLRKPWQPLAEDSLRQTDWILISETRSHVPPSSELVSCSAQPFFPGDRVVCPLCPRQTSNRRQLATEFPLQFALNLVPSALHFVAS